MKRIYLDHNATTPVRLEVLEVMLPFLREQFGNPSSIHSYGQEAKRGIDEAREKVAKLLQAHPSEIVFTAGGTEANNLAIQGAAYAHREKGRHLITSSVEHPAVLNTCQHLEGEGFYVTYLPVDVYGRVDPDHVKEAIRPDTILVTIMHSNNEVGTIQPIEEIGGIAGELGVLFHTDAVQSSGKLSVNVERLGVDLLSISAHKVCGPKGMGALYLKDGVRIQPQIHGGHHEMNRRAGTENVAGIVGFGRAAELASAEVTLFRERTGALRDYFWERLRQKIDHVSLNGHPVERLPNTLNVRFEAIEGDSIIINLDLQGVAASAGSACTSGAQKASHVLLAMGMTPRAAQESLRFSLGRTTTKEEIEEALDALTKTVDRLRPVSAWHGNAERG